MRKVVVEVQCSRCKRKETREYEPGKPGADGESVHAFSATLNLGHPTLTDGGRRMQVAFDDLCQPCERSVRALLDQIGKCIDGLSPDRDPAKKPKTKAQAKKEEPAPAAPTPRVQPPAPAKSPAAVRSS